MRLVERRDALRLVETAESEQDFDALGDDELKELFEALEKEKRVVAFQAWLDVQLGKTHVPPLRQGTLDSKRVEVREAADNISPRTLDNWEQGLLADTQQSGKIQSLVSNVDERGWWLFALKEAQQPDIEERAAAQAIKWAEYKAGRPKPAKGQQQALTAEDPNPAATSMVPRAGEPGGTLQLVVNVLHSVDLLYAGLRRKLYGVDDDESQFSTSETDSGFWSFVESGLLFVLRAVSRHRANLVVVARVSVLGLTFWGLSSAIERGPSYSLEEMFSPYPHDAWSIVEHATVNREMDTADN